MNKPIVETTDAARPQNSVKQHWHTGAGACYCVVGVILLWIYLTMLAPLIDASLKFSKFKTVQQQQATLRDLVNKGLNRAKSAQAEAGMIKVLGDSLRTLFPEFQASELLGSGLGETKLEKYEKEARTNTVRRD